MIKIRKIPFMAHRKRKPTQEAAPPTMALTAAWYDGGLPSVFLAFDREINIDGLDPASITVESDESTAVWGGLSAWTTDPVTMQVQLVRLSSYGGSDTRLTVDADNGIVGADDGAIYPGVSELVLPFP